MNTQTIAMLILLAINLMSLGIHLGKDGEPRDGYYSFGKMFLSFCIVMVLYYFAGLFDNFLN